jgi:cysteine synthase
VGFLAEVLDRAVVDEVIAVSDADAFATARKLVRMEGIIAGASSGAALHAALAIAGRPELDDRMIVAILPDTGERYITTDLFAADPYPEESAI